MPLKKQKFTILKDDLTKAIDIDDGLSLSVPVNMNFVEVGYLIKDTGFVPHGGVPQEKRHSLFTYTKKNGDSYFISAQGTTLQQYLEVDREWVNIANSPTFTTDAEFGYVVYDDNLYLCNAVESYYRFDGTTFTEYASAPKGNILEIFEDRLFVAGVLAEPLTTYYSNVGVPTTFAGANVIKPTGTDHITGQVNFFGAMLIFKRDSIWKLSFVFDQVVSLFVPKLEIQNGQYGACGRKAISWVENDIWFFTGSEVRSIGYKDQQIGVLGVNTSVISETIKEALSNINIDYYYKITTLYNNRRYYLCLPLGGTENDTTFVSHLLYGQAWTKYTGRAKARIGSSTVNRGIIYTSNDSVSYGAIKWTVTAADALPLNSQFITET